MEWWLIWLIVAALLVIIELLTNFIASFCVAVGCLVAMALSLIGCGINAQLLGLAIGMVVAFIVLAPLMRKLYRKDTKCKNESGSNMDALIGRIVIVSEEIPVKGIGRVKVDGVNWQARCEDNESIAVGTSVKIVGNDSIILNVERI